MTWYNPTTWGNKPNNIRSEQKQELQGDELDLNLDEMNMDETPPDDPNEPWVHIKGAVHDPENGVEIKLDWNEAFVKYLRENGINASSDEAVVQKYLAMLNRQMLDEYQNGEGSHYE